jgi:hypothetical protein
MSDLNRRLKKIENVMNIDKPRQKVLNIVDFSDGELEPDKTDGNITIHHIRYSDICRKDNQQCEIVAEE